MIQAALLVEIHQHTNTSTSMTDSRLPAATGCPWTSYRPLPPAAPVHSTENGRQMHAAVGRHNTAYRELVRRLQTEFNYNKTRPSG